MTGTLPSSESAKSASDSAYISGARHGFLYGPKPIIARIRASSFWPSSVRVSQSMSLNWRVSNCSLSIESRSALKKSHDQI